MIKEIIYIIKSINTSYIITSILLIISTIIFLKKKEISKNKSIIIILLEVLILLYCIFTVNDPLNKIFKLQYISLRLYILILIITNIITLITINKKINKSAKILNKSIYVINSLILLLNLIIITGIKTNYFITKPIVIIKLININIIIFIVYLNILLVKYIIINSIINIYNKKHHHIINGVDCSIIFEDKNIENRNKNYEILKKDITAKLTNGYTLEETKIIKNVINKLNITDINNLNLSINKLNSISEEEYLLLKKFINSHSNITKEVE